MDDYNSCTLTSLGPIRETTPSDGELRLQDSKLRPCDSQEFRKMILKLRGRPPGPVDPRLNWYLKIASQKARLGPDWQCCSPVVTVVCLRCHEVLRFTAKPSSTCQPGHVPNVTVHRPKRAAEIHVVPVFQLSAHYMSLPLLESFLPIVDRTAEPLFATRLADFMIPHRWQVQKVSFI